MKWKLLLALSGILLAQLASATDDLYQNTDASYYYVYYSQVSYNPPPTIDATNFDNESIFSVSWENYAPYPVLYKTHDTLNFTNESRAQMIANSPPATNGALVNFVNSFGSGFQFDLYTTNLNPDAMAGTVYNAGDIRCDSIVDGNNLFNLGGGFYAYLVTSLGQFKAIATNVICPGSIEVGTGGLIQMTAQNLDLSGGALSVESLLNTTGNPSLIGTMNTGNFQGSGAIGIDTNGDWNPGLDLGPNYALSSFVPIAPSYVSLTNSQCYIDTRVIQTNYVINRCVFVQNVTNAAQPVTYNVYIDDPNTSSLGFEAGAAHVEWVGNYTDPASGNPNTSYLYLTDDYEAGTGTNAGVGLNGMPGNYQFLVSSTPLLLNPTPQSFTLFPFGPITNNYSVMFGTLNANTVVTNSSVLNPSGNVTNLPAAIKLSSSNTLNLAFSTISGANYLSINCTNQFEGSPGATISAPFSDIALGVTNGTLTFSNVLAANVPNWSGTVQAWSTVFSTVDAFGNTNEFRVLLVFSDLQPTSIPWTQNLYLHGTNLVVSDPLNVYGSFYSDARVLTLNTNQAGVGATSLSGQINWIKGLPFNANSGSGLQQMPNLLWLTNNGSIQADLSVNMGNPSTFVSVTPPTPPVRASGALAEIGTNVVLNDRVVIGTNRYVFVKTLTNTVPNQVQWATSFNSSLTNLIAAINGTTGSGKYSTATKANPAVTAGPRVGKTFTVTAVSTNAAVGDAVATLFVPATTAVNLSWGGLLALTNGLNYVPAATNYTAFVNNGLLADQGTTVWTSYFESDQPITNGVGSFTLHSGQAILTNSALYAGGDVMLVATNSPGMGPNSLFLSNQVIQAGGSLSLWTTNLAGDALTNNNVWSVGGTSGGGAADSGFNTWIKPVFGNLLGTTVTNIAPHNKTIYNVWAGTDYGLSPRGYTNNLAIGHLVLDSRTTNIQPPVAFVFSGATSSNAFALYVDLLELKNGAAFGNNTNSFNFPWLKINTNMMVYFAQATINGMSVAEDIDNASQNGANGGRLRWVYSYAGYLSSTNSYYTNVDGTVTTNVVNAALAASNKIDSDGDGQVNSQDGTPFFVPQEFNFTAIPTNHPPKSIRLQWTTIPNATNFVYYTTNLLATNWLAFTNFSNWYYGNNVAVTNAARVNGFRSPQIYQPNGSLADNAQQTNVWVTDVITNVPHYYKVVVWPWLNYEQ